MLSNSRGSSSKLVGFFFFFFCHAERFAEITQPGMEPASLAAIMRYVLPTVLLGILTGHGIELLVCIAAIQLVHCLQVSAVNATTQLICLFCSFLIFPFAEHKEINLSATRWNTSGPWEVILKNSWEEKTLRPRRLTVGMHRFEEEGSRIRAGGWIC